MAQSSDHGCGIAWCAVLLWACAPLPVRMLTVSCCILWQVVVCLRASDAFSHATTIELCRAYLLKNRPGQSDNYDHTSPLSGIPIQCNKKKSATCKHKRLFCLQHMNSHDSSTSPFSPSPEDNRQSYLIGVTVGRLNKMNLTHKLQKVYLVVSSASKTTNISILS